MLGSEIIAQAREYLDDLVVPYLWSNSFLVVCLNRAVNDIHRETEIVSDSSTVAICQYSVMGSTPLITLDSRVTIVRSGQLNSQTTKLSKVFKSEMDNYQPNWQRTPAATGVIPQYYIPDLEEGKVFLSPYYPGSTLTTVDTLLIDCFRLPITQFTEANMAALSPEFSSMWHDRIADGIAMYAYHKQDSQTYNPEQAEKFRRLFKDRNPDGSVNPDSLIFKMKEHLNARSARWNSTMGVRLGAI